MADSESVPASKGPQQQGKKGLKRFPKSDFAPGKPYGQGGFGNVITGKLDGKFVVVKILHSPVDEGKFKVLNKMSKLQDKSLIRFMGVLDQGESLTECPQLVFKHANKGNLLDWLRNAKGQTDQKTLNKFTCDIINGMSYLHKMKFVHGCLAARNVLLDEFYDKQNPGNKTYLNAQISDYGLSQITEGVGANYCKISAAAEKTVSIRWMPKEAIRIDANNKPCGEVTFPSDVWSFAVVLFEVWTRGDIPYGMTASNLEVRQNIEDGKSPLTFHLPANCPENVLAVMKNIFNAVENPAERPTFLDLQKSFDSISGGRPPPQKQQDVPSKQGNQNQQNKNQHPAPGKDTGKGDVPKQNKGKQERGAPSAQAQDQKKNMKGGNPAAGDMNYKSSAKSKNQQQQKASGGSANKGPPPPYTPPTHMNPGQGQMGMGQYPTYPPQGYPQTVGYPNFPAAPGYPQAPVAMGMVGGYPFAPPTVGPMAMGGPPPPYAVAAGIENAASLEQTVRELQQKINTLEVNNQVKQLEQQIQGLQQQQNKKPQSNAGKKPQPSGPPDKPNRGRGGQNRGRGGGRGGSAGSGTSANGGQQQQPSTGMPDWVPLAGAAIAGGLVAGAAAIAAANANSKSKGEAGKNKKK